MSKNQRFTSRLSVSSWIWMLVIAMLGIGLWRTFSFSRMSAVSLRIDRPLAVGIAREYLSRHFGIDPQRFQIASVFLTQENVDTYLQRVLGSNGELDFLRTYDYDLFYWRIRFFRPGDKEEFHLAISSRSGQIIQFNHIIDETAARAECPKEEARKIAEDFLRNNAGVKLDQYIIKDETQQTKEKRTEFGFSWKHKNVDIVWDRLPNSARAKLLVGVVVSGREVLSYYKGDLSVPDAFTRYLEKEMELGQNLSAIFDIAYKLLIVLMIVQLINCRQHLALRTVRPLLIRISILLGSIALLSSLNHFESILMGYPTSQDFSNFLGRSYFNALQQAIWPSLAWIMLALAAEAAYSRESIDSDRRGSLLYYARSTFLSREVAYSLIYGCLLACFLLGVQSLIFAFGERFFGVWTESYWLTEFSSAHWPFLAALYIGLRASLLEEITFRVFAINWISGKLRSVMLAVIIGSVIWGFGHSGYKVYPMWFRGFEVSLLGFIFSWGYLRFGILAVLVAHYLFDVFWASAGCLFTPSAPMYFWSSVLVLSIPLLWAFGAWWANRSPQLRPLDWNLNLSQKFHLRVLEAFVKQASQEGRNLADLRKTCLNHSWDPAVVDKAFEAYERNNTNVGPT